MLWDDRSCCFCWRFSLPFKLLQLSLMSFILTTEPILPRHKYIFDFSYLFCWRYEQFLFNTSHRKISNEARRTCQLFHRHDIIWTLRCNISKIIETLIKYISIPYITYVNLVEAAKNSKMNMLNGDELNGKLGKLSQIIRKTVYDILCHSSILYICSRLLCFILTTYMEIWSCMKQI